MAGLRLQPDDHDGAERTDALDSAAGGRPVLNLETGVSLNSTLRQIFRAPLPVRGGIQAVTHPPTIPTPSFRSHVSTLATAGAVRVRRRDVNSRSVREFAGNPGDRRRARSLRRPPV